jgi:hypothetical protein
MLYLVPIDMNKNEIRNSLFHVLAADPGSPTEGQVYYNSVSKTFRFYTGVAWRVLGTLDQISAPAADLDLNSHKITNLTTPVSAGDAANKSYVDSVAQGIAWKAPVRAATTVAGTLATSFENGDVIDGVTLATGDRILIKNQAAPADNGIYVVAASGAPTRATDADTATEVTQAAVLVEEGTTLADTLWVNSTNAPITLNTTGLVFVRIGGATAYTAGNGIDITGTTITAVADPAGGLAVTASGIGVTAPLGIALGGTGGITAAAARTALGVPGHYAVDVGDGAATSIDVVHNLGTRDVVVEVYQNSSTWDKVFTDVRHKDANTVTLIFAVAPASAAYRCVVIG